MEDVHRSNHEKCWMSGDILVITPTKMGDSCVANKIPMSSLKNLHVSLVKPHFCW